MHSMHTFLNNPNCIMNLSTEQKSKLFTRDTPTQNIFDPDGDNLANDRAKILKS